VAYALAYGNLGTEVALDNLKFGVATETITDAFGAYHFAVGAAGSYQVEVVAPENWGPTIPEDSQLVTVASVGALLADVNFGQHTTVLAWQNPGNAFDVNRDQVVTPLDALLLIIEMNQRGAYALGEAPAEGNDYPFYDVSGDSFLTPLDPLLIINHLNSQSGLMSGTDGLEDSLPPPEDEGDGHVHSEGSAETVGSVEAAGQEPGMTDGPGAVQTRSAAVETVEGLTTPLSAAHDAILFEWGLLQLAPADGGDPYARLGGRSATATEPQGAELSLWDWWLQEAK
jgi:hypothetical protein